MTRIAAAVGLLLTLLLAPMGPAHAQATSTLLIVNVHHATPQGCGDWGGGPHYSYKVFINGAQVASSNTVNPTNGVVQFNDLVTVDLGTQSSLTGSATVGFQVIDHSWFLWSQSETACNLTADDQTTLTFQYTVGQPQLVRSGSSHAGAAIEAYVSDSSLPSPVAPTLHLVGNPTPTTANFSWDAMTVPGFLRADLVDTSQSDALQGSTASPAASAMVWTGMEENTQHRGQLRAHGGSWIVASNAVSFTTANLPPPPPQLTLGQVNDTAASFGYSNPPHDAASLALFVSTDPGMSANASTARGSFAPPWWDLGVSGLQPSTTYYVIARATDTAGASTDGSVWSFATAASTAAPAPATQPTSATPTQPPTAPPSQPAPTTPTTATPTPAPTSGPAPATPTTSTPPGGSASQDRSCCVMVQILTAVSQGGYDVGQTVDVSLRSTAYANVTVSLWLADGSRSLDVQPHAPLATLTVAAQSSQEVSVVLPAPAGMVHGTGVAKLVVDAAVPGSTQSWETLNLRVPLQTWELQQESFDSELEMKGPTLWVNSTWGVFAVSSELAAGPGVSINATPGSVIDVPILLVNHADHPLFVEAGMSFAMRNDSDLHRLVNASEYMLTFAPLNATLPPLSKLQTHATLRVSLEAPTDDVVAGLIGFNVSNGVKSGQMASFIRVAMRPGPPMVAALPPVQASAPATSAGVDAQVGPLGGHALLYGTLAGGGVVALGAAAVVMRRDAARFAVAAALYTRLAKSDVLDHAGRDEVHKLIQRQPGICYSEIKRSTAMNTGALVHHLRTLEGHGIVRSRREAAYRRFYPAAHAPPPLRVDAFPTTPMQAKILALLAEQPMTQGEIAERLGLSQQGTSYHVKGLERAGRIEATLSQGEWRYAPIVVHEVQP